MKGSASCLINLCFAELIIGWKGGNASIPFSEKDLMILKLSQSRVAAFAQFARK